MVCAWVVPEVTGTLGTANSHFDPTQTGSGTAQPRSRQGHRIHAYRLRNRHFNIAPRCRSSLSKVLVGFRTTMQLTCVQASQCLRCCVRGKDTTRQCFLFVCIVIEMHHASSTVPAVLCQEYWQPHSRIFYDKPQKVFP